MARARNIKPGFFKNEILGEMDTSTRLLFIGLWTLADREGRLEDRPRRIKMELFPYDSFDVDPMLEELQTGGFLVRYIFDEVRYIQLVNFVKHQDPHYREKASEIPPPDGHENKITATNVTRTQRARILERDNYTCQQCDSKEHLCVDHVIPVSRGGDSSDDNLQILCLPCNTKKSNKLDSSSGQRRVDIDSNKVLDAPLIPDSLIPDSPTPDGVGSAPKVARPSRGSILPADWVLPKSWGEWAVAERPELGTHGIRLEGAKFADHWHANANQRNGKKSDWLAAWRNWIRSARIEKPPNGVKPMKGHGVISDEKFAEWLDNAKPQGAIQDVG